MNRLTEIRDMAADPTVSLEQVLLKCVVLADVLGDKNLLAWATQELEGYSDSDDLPDYRMSSGTAWAEVTNGRHTETIIVSSMEFLAPVPSYLRARLTALPFPGGVRSLEIEEHITDLVRPIHPGMWQYIDQHLQASSKSKYRTTDAYIEIAPSDIPGILGTIRSRILKYVICMRENFPNLDDDLAHHTVPTPQQMTQMIQNFNMTLGDGAAISFGGNAFAQTIYQQVIAGDLASLRTFLLEQGVSSAEVGDLESLLPATTPADLDDGSSPIRKWIKTAADKASTGATDLVKTAAREIVQQAVKAYFTSMLGSS